MHLENQLTLAQVSWPLVVKGDPNRVPGSWLQSSVAPQGWSLGGELEKGRYFYLSLCVSLSPTSSLSSSNSTFQTNK